MSYLKTSVVITTFNSEHIIDKCIQSIPSDVSIIIIENSNNINFKLDIESKYSNVKCTLAGSNIGYSRANNLGLSLVKSEYALVLNPDAKLKKNTLDIFFEEAKKNKDFWLIGPINNQGKFYEKNNYKIFEVKNLKGFAIFFNLKNFNSKFFDENFFLYFEEIDICKRIVDNNGKIYLSPKIEIDHEGSNSVNRIFHHELEKNRNWHWMWSSFYFNRKYKGFLIDFILIYPKLLSSLIKTLIYLLIFNKKKKIFIFAG